MENFQKNKIKYSFKSEEINIAFANVDFSYQDEVSKDCVIVTKSGNRRVVKYATYLTFSEEYDEWCQKR